MKYIKLFEANKNFKQLNDCIRRGTLAELKEMIANDYDVNGRMEEFPPIIMAIAEKKYSMAQELIKSGADVNARHSNDFTALYVALRNREIGWGFPHKIRKSLNRFILLINAGANWYNINKDKDVFHYLKDEDFDAIKDECPDLYKEYMFRKTMKNYNL
jgi:hypothetical protein